MKRMLLALHFKLGLIGIDIRKLYYFVKGSIGYLGDYIAIKKRIDEKVFPFGRLYPILDEKSTAGGTMSGHYFHQDLLVARRIFEKKPQRHIDIGSRVDGFIAHCAVFREIEIFDIRDIKGSVSNIKFTRANLMEVPLEMHASCDSISSLHAIEHFGLGRYGDPIDGDGHLLALRSIHSILAPAGTFYFSVPIGPQRIEFNAHRVFSVTYLVDILEPMFRIERFSYVDDRGDLHTNVNIDSENAANNFGCVYGAGIFELTKL